MLSRNLVAMFIAAVCLFSLAGSQVAEAQCCNYAGLINNSCSAKVYVVSNTTVYGPYMVAGGTSLFVPFASTTECLRAYIIDGCRIDVPWTLTVTCVNINCPTVCTVQRQLCITSNPCVYRIQ